MQCELAEHSIAKPQGWGALCLIAQLIPKEATYVPFFLLHRGHNEVK